MIGQIVLAMVVGAVLFVWLRSTRGDATVPATAEQRMHGYERRVDAAVGMHSDAHMARVARGITAKSALLDRLARRDALRQPIAPDRALVPVSAVRVRYTGKRRCRLRAVA